MNGDSAHENCMAHTGQEEKIRSVSGKLTLVLWLLGILIGLVGGVGGGLYGSMQALNLAVAGFTARLSVIETKIQSLETMDGRVIDRLDQLERVKK